MSVVPLPSASRWVSDHRGGGRAVRVTAHPEAGVVVLSVWRADECAATVRLDPAEAAELAGAVAAGLAALTAPTGPRARS